MTNTTTRLSPAAAVERINEPPNLTFAYVRDQLRKLGLVLAKDQAGDFRVRHRGAKPGEGYYTDDLGDALDTGRAMALADARPEGHA